MARRRETLLGLSGALVAGIAFVSPASAQVNLGELFVTATGRAESTSRIVGTTEVITREQIERSTAKSVTDLLADNAVGFLTQWTSDQTQIVIRGAATEGQGRDYKSEVLVLINGHRAGTANVSKLSLADVDHIEIVRGPSSVVYGSQNMGGVINIILKTGKTAPGSLLQAEGGSWDLLNGKAQHGATKGEWDYYVGVAGGSQGNYAVGGHGGTELNTAWQRHGETGSLGWQANENNRFETTFRQDGIYDAGFRGSGWSINDVDSRYNGSVDFNYYGKTNSDALKWFWQTYAVQDVDNLNQPQTLSPAASPSTSYDDNKRTQDLFGSRFQPRISLWPTNELLIGWDYEHETLRSTRYDVGLGGAAVTQPSPTDNNQHETSNAFYFEDAQTLFEKWTIRGGVRQTFGETTLDPTENVNLLTSTHDYKALTYSTGSTYLITDWLTSRIGASTGFRAPTATELGQNYIVNSSGTVTYGNPGLVPENSQQVEVGATASWPFARFDLALFQNRILDRITTQAIGMTAAGATISQEINNPGAVDVQGVELQYRLDMLKMLTKTPQSWFWSVYGNAYYNFRMSDEGLASTVGAANVTDADRALRMYESQVTFNSRFGQQGAAWHDWSLEVTGIFNGRMWYNTEEHLTIPGQVANVTIFEKSPYMLWNIKGELKVTDNVTIFGKINNIFNVNYDPIFIALYEVPCIGSLHYSNGSCGNSLPGREFIAGMTARF